MALIVSSPSKKKKMSSPHSVTKLQRTITISLWGKRSHPWTPSWSQTSTIFWKNYIQCITWGYYLRQYYQKTLNKQSFSCKLYWIMYINQARQSKPVTKTKDNIKTMTFLQFPKIKLRPNSWIFVRWFFIIRMLSFLL